MGLLAPALIVGAFLLAVGNGQGLKCTTGPCKLNDKSVRFYVIGDWGGSRQYPYVTSGQRQCANFLTQYGPYKRPHFFVSTGDNFYDVGVKNADDPRFKITFDDVFTYGKAEGVPWYVTMGNHDWYGNASAQLYYTYKNKRWVAPWYQFKVAYDSRPTGPSVDFVFLDTWILCGNTQYGTRSGQNQFSYKDDDDYRMEAQYGVTGSRLRGFKGYVGASDPYAASNMWQYIEDRMAQSKANYLFLVGHYPAFVSDFNSVNKCLVPKLQALMEKYQATGYLNGHSHTLQHLQTTSQLNARPIHHILSGAGHLTSSDFQPVFTNLYPNPWKVTSKYFFPPKQAGMAQIREDQGGLVYIEMGAKSGRAEYYNCNGQYLYSFEMQPRF